MRYANLKRKCISSRKKGVFWLKKKFNGDLWNMNNQEFDTDSVRKYNCSHTENTKTELAYQAPDYNVKEERKDYPK